MMDESKTSALWGPIGRGVSGASYVIAFFEPIKFPKEP